MRIVLVIVIGACFASCFNDADCLIDATNYMHLQFKKNLDKTDSALALTSIFVSGTDSVITFKQDSLMTEILLPLDIHNTTTTYILNRVSLTDPNLTGADTLQVSYRPQTKVIAHDCGAFTYYKDLTVVKTNIPSTHLKIFSTNLLKDPTLSDVSAYAVNYQIFH